MATLDQYDVVPLDERAMYDKANVSSANRRENKIKQYQKEKEITQKLEVRL